MDGASWALVEVGIQGLGPSRAQRAQNLSLHEAPRQITGEPFPRLWSWKPAA